MKQVNWIGIILSLVLTIAPSKAVDRTKTAKATGSDVVQSVVDRIGQMCIFPNDRLFVRRMAYVETEDGKDGSTFSPSFYGGIWQITESDYNATRPCKGKLQDICNQIKKNFSIDWQTTTWKDLLKPFYSGLATYLCLALRDVTVPGNPVEQGKVWRKVFHPKAFTHPRNFSEVSNLLSSNCDGKADVVFLLDESGSVGQTNFDKVKNFLVESAKRLTIGPNEIRVSIVKFGSSPTIISYLNQDDTYSKVVQSINRMTYGGTGTATDLGINEVTDNVFSTQNGANEAKDAPRILVLVTDGQSNNEQLTLVAADNAKSKEIEIFSVGVGNGIDYDELRRVASKCNRVFTVNTFDDFDSFIYELTKGTCEAKSHVTIPKSSENATDDVVFNRTIPGDKVTGGVVVDSDSKNDTEGHTIVIESHCAVVKIYGSHDNENPSESMFEITGTASDGRPIVLFVKANKDGKPLFLSFEATRVNTTEKVCFNDSSFVVKINRGKPKVGEVICKENGVLRNCTSVDLIDSKWRDKICPRFSDISTIGNPCTPDRLRAKELFFPYPNDNTKFLKCDLKGRVYVIVCPVGLFYEPGRDSCGTDSNIPDTKKPLGGGHKNPCTHENIIQNHFYFPHPGGRHYYIHCDEWGGAWVVPCPDKDVWDQKILQCIPENVEAKSPCTEEARNKGIFFFPYPGDKHKYIHCDNRKGHFIVQSCGNMIYNDEVHNCLPG